MTPAELKAEYAYRVAERISILTDGGEPSPEQVLLAEQEARLAVAELERMEDNRLF